MRVPRYALAAVSSASLLGISAFIYTQRIPSKQPPPQVAIPNNPQPIPKADPNTPPTRPQVRRFSPTSLPYAS